MDDRDRTAATNRTDATEEPHDAVRDTHASAPTARRRTYTPPRLERLGGWHALTLQQSIPIGPGSY